jgi:glycosyltransferase involved in cell wall biosynthesis
MTIAISHTTIAVSDNIRNAFVGWPCIKGKIVVIRNGIKIGAGYGKSGARLAMSGMFPQLKVALAEKNVYWIGTIAELHPVKDIGSAIKAVSKLIEEKRGRGGASHVLPYFIYTVIGEGRERAHLEEMIISLGLSERIFLLGQIPDAFQYIKAFDVFLLPSKSEALGYVLIEAGTQETPVVATAVGGIPEVIEDMRSGVLIQPDKPGEIANAIEFYVKHPDVARSYARALHQAVKADFSLEKMIKGTEGVYEEK